MILTCQECGEFVEQGDAHCSECGCEVAQAETVKTEFVDVVSDGVDFEADTVISSEAMATSANDEALDNCDTLVAVQELAEFPNSNLAEVSCSEQLSQFDSDNCSECSHFSLEFNEGSSVFSVGYGSSFQFKLKPSDRQSLAAENVEIKVCRDDSVIVSKKFRVIPQRLRPISFYMNCTPESGHEGADICLDVVLSYFIDGKRYCYAENIVVDVYAANIAASQMIENLHVRIDNLQQEGAKHAGDQGDQKVCLFDSLGKSHDRNEIMSKLKQAELWHALPLYKHIDCDSARLFVPPVPLNIVKSNSFLLTSLSGEKLYLHPGSMTLGRSRDCSYCTRNMPRKGENWDQQTLRERNLKISSQHCRVSIDKGEVYVYDCNSANGTFLDDKRVSTGGRTLASSGIYSLSLAPKSMSPNNYELRLKVLKGSRIDISCFDASLACLATTGKKHEESHVVINGIIDLNRLLPAFSDKLYVVLKGGCWAVTDLDKWTWLDESGSVGNIKFSRV